MPPAAPLSDRSLSTTRRVVVRAAWLGLATGMVEGIVPLVQHTWFGRMRIYAPAHIAWMSPLAGLVVFLIVGTVLATALHPLQRRSPARALQLATTALAFLATWSITLLFPQLSQWAALILAAGVGTQVGRLTNGEGLDRLARRTLVPLGGAVAVLAAAMVLVPRGREARAIAALPAPPSDAPNVLLLILDTVRAQSMSLYGASDPTTPRLDSLAQSAVVFERAIATAPWTVPSHASMLTGRYPHELTVDWLTPLDDTTTTLAQVLSRHGYVTGAFMANYMMSTEVRLERGFQRYRDYGISARQLLVSSAVLRRLAYWPRLRRVLGRYDTVNRKRAPAANAELLEWLDQRTARRPFFAVVNYMDAHEVYAPPAPFRGRFGPDSVRHNEMTRYGLGGLGFRLGKAAMTPSQVQGELHAYEESLASLDHHLGALLDSLKARGVLDETVVIVTSDHGEHFGEHKKWEHANTLYPQLLHVPLLVRAPGRAPAGLRVRDFVSLRDVAATVLAMGPKSAELPGRTLSHHWDTTAVGSTRPVSPILASFSSGTWTPQSPASTTRGWRSVVLGGQLVIEQVRTPTHFEVYDLEADPEGTRDLANDARGEAAMRAARAFLQPVLWQSQAPSVHRTAGSIGSLEQR